jgi:formate hydrogenlyase transcriptional activator
VGQSAGLKAVLKQVKLVAPTDSTVLVQGETGTGKELVARMIHEAGSRRDQPFVKLNCSAIPAGLLESELFGHERGAFTGATTSKAGRFELAHRGTLFLDEIGDVPLELQPKLLRVLQEQEFERLGSNRTLRVDVRLVAATNRDLAAMVEEQEFRADLFYRLDVFPIVLPPLRERLEDVPLLAWHFARIYAERMGKPIDTIALEGMESLRSYHWPGNIRELQNVIERAVILSPGRRLELGHWLRRPTPVPGDGRLKTLAEDQREHILRALALTGWRVSGPKGAALLLGIKPTTLEARMKKLGIQRERPAVPPA